LKNLIVKKTRLKLVQFGFGFISLKKIIQFGYFFFDKNRTEPKIITPNKEEDEKKNIRSIKLEEILIGPWRSKKKNIFLENG